MLPRAPRSPRSRGFRPALESLEERCVPDATDFRTQPVVPVIDALTKDHLRAVYNSGLTQGNRASVFAKVGDSITDSQDFLYALGNASYNVADPSLAGRHTGLASVVQFFRQQSLDGPFVNSFNRVSRAAARGWRTEEVLTPLTQLDPLRSPQALAYETPQTAELRAIRPSVALIMLGTNDLVYEPTPETFRARLTSVVTTALDAGVIPVLSTIPDHQYLGGAFQSRVPLYNQVINEVAFALDVPLWNYWLALQGLPNQGVSGDGVHPSTYPAGAGYLTDDALLYGYNVRNLTALQVLDKVMRVVLQDGTADTAERPVRADTLRYVDNLYATLLGRAPDAGGRSVWAHAIEIGLPREYLAWALWYSPEHRGVQVDNYYSTFLRRPADAAGRAFWVNALVNGTLSEFDLQRALLTSTAYLIQNAGDNFLPALYRDTLGRAPDEGGMAAVKSALQGGLGIETLVGFFLASDEGQAHAVNRLYQNLLSRDPGLEAEQFWIDMFRHGHTTYEMLAITLLTSEEFRRR